MLKTKLGLMVICCFFVNTFYGQRKTDSIKINKIYISPVPLISSEPSQGVLFGVAATAGSYFGDPKNTIMSNAFLMAAYTTKDQILIALKSNAYTSENKYNFIGDYRVFFSSQETFGLGTGVSENQTGYNPNDTGDLMEFDLVRFHQTVLKKVGTDLYAGLGYHLDVYSNINDINFNEGQQTAHSTYSKQYGYDSEGYMSSALSFNLSYDTRDVIGNAYQGSYIFGSFKVLPEFLGNDYGATSLWLEYREYFKLSKDHPRRILALWTYFNSVTSGQVPYMSLPALGWDQMGRSGRGFKQGRFRGEGLYYAEVEYRTALPVLKSKPDLFGAVFFANMTTASNSDAEIRLFDTVEPAFGAGLRVMLRKASRANLTIDYAKGLNGDSGFYLNLSETF